MRLCETQLYLGKDVKECCWSIPQEQLDFNDAPVEIGDHIACKYCGQKFVLLMSTGQDPQPLWSPVKWSWIIYLAVPGSYRRHAEYLL